MPAPATEADFKADITGEFSEILDPEGLVIVNSTVVDVKWRLHQDKGAIGLEYQAQWVRADCAAYAQTRKVDEKQFAQGGVEEDGSPASKLQKIYENAIERIGMLSDRARLSDGTTVSEMATVTPQEGFAGGVNPNYPTLGGDPRYRRWRW